MVLTLLLQEGGRLHACVLTPYVLGAMSSMELSAVQLLVFAARSAAGEVFFCGEGGVGTRL